MSYQSRNRTIPRKLYVTEAAVPPYARAAVLPSLGRRVVLTVILWRQRVDMRRRLAEMDSRSLRELGISPAAAAYESGKPFWRRVGCLR